MLRDKRDPLHQKKGVSKGVQLLLNDDCEKGRASIPSPCGRCQPESGAENSVLKMPGVGREQMSDDPDYEEKLLNFSVLFQNCYKYQLLCTT